MFYRCLVTGIAVVALGACSFKGDGFVEEPGNDEDVLALGAQRSAYGVGVGRAESEEIFESAVEAGIASAFDSTSANSVPLDESAAVRRALGRGLDVALAEISLDEFQFETDLAKSALLPRLVGVVDVGDDGENIPANLNRRNNDDVGAGVYLRQDLLSWGANRKRFKAAGMMKSSQESVVEMQKVDTAAAIHIGFATLRKLDRAKQAYRESIVGYREFSRKADQRNEAGVDSGRSVQEINSRIAELEAGLATLEVEEEGTKMILDRLVGSDGDTEFKLYPAVMHSLPAGVDDRSNAARRPDVVALERQLTAAELELKARKADRWPVVTVSGGIRSESDFEFDRERSEATASASSRWVPIEGGAHRARTKLAQANIDSLRLQLENARKVADAEVQTGLAAVKRAQAAASASGRALALTRKSLDLTKAQQEAQRSAIDHVLNVQQRVLRAELQKAEAEFVVQREKVLVKRSMGTMVDDGVTQSAKNGK